MKGKENIEKLKDLGAGFGGGKSKSKKLTKAKLVILALVVAIAVSFPGAIEEVKKGELIVKQAAITGDMTAHMEPGWMLQLFGDLETFPKEETFYFTYDKLEGENIDQSMEVRFVDGSLCNISGTLRVVMPNTEDEAIYLVADRSFTTYTDVEERLVRPILRKVLRLTATFMTAQQSYAEKRPNFIFWVQDQLENGIYATEETMMEVEDPVTGKKVLKKANTIKYVDGIAQRSEFPLKGTGVRLLQVEIKKFKYADVVRDQIAEQQRAYMNVATARAKAEEAKARKQKLEEEGKAEVAKVKYEQLKEKEKKVIKAQEKLEVASLDRQAAEEKKKELILLGEGEAKRKQLNMQADGALQPKLDALVKIEIARAEAMAKINWPEFYMNGGGTGDGNALQALFQQFLVQQNMATMKALNIDTSVPTAKTKK